jgi:PhnB protein
MNESILHHVPVIHEVYPYLCVSDGAAAIDFYVRVFGAKELMRLAYPDGRIAHAELQLGPATLMLTDEHPEYGIRSPLALGGTGTTIHLHVDDVDALTARAVEAGATVLRPPTDEGHGERQARVRDPFGHEWLLGHQIAAVSEEEIQRRFAAEFGQEVSPSVRSEPARAPRRGKLREGGRSFGTIDS